MLLAMYITNQNLGFDIFVVGNLQNVVMGHDVYLILIFDIKEKSIIVTKTMYFWLLEHMYIQHKTHRYFRSDCYTE